MRLTVIESDLEEFGLGLLRAIGAVLCGAADGQLAAD